MSADVRAQLAAQQVVLKIIARQLLERGVVGGGEAAADLDGIARMLGPGRRVVDAADRRTDELPREWAGFFRGPEPPFPREGAPEGPASAAPLAAATLRSSRPAAETIPWP